LAQISEATEDSRPRTKFGLLVPGSIDEVSAYIGNSRESALEGVEDKDLPDLFYSEGNERENTPDGVRRDKDIAGLGDGEKRRGRDLEYGVEDEINCRHVIVVFALRRESEMTAKLLLWMVSLPGS